MAVTQAELLDELRRLAEELGRTPTIQEMDEQGAYTGRTYFNHFDSWNAAIEKAGLEKNVEHAVSREDLVEDLTHIHDKIDDVQPTARAIKEHTEYSLQTYYREFDGLDEALDAAGIEKTEEDTISKAEIVREIKRLATEGSPPPTEQMDEEGAFSARTCFDRFGSWNEAVRAAGYDPHLDPPPATRADLLEEVERLHDELGRTPTVRDMRDHGKYTPGRYFDNFESWNDAVAEVGLTPREQVMDPAEQRIPQSELIDEIRRLGEQIGGRPTCEDMLEQGAYSTKPYYRQFGSWNRAVELAGYTPFTGTSEDIYSADELRTELQRVADIVDRAPTVKDMREHGAISTQPFVRRFGSWVDALRAAGLEPTEHQLRRGTDTA